MGPKMNKKIIPGIVAILLLIDGVYAQKRYESGTASIRAEVYEPIDLVFKANPTTHENPFDVQLSAAFTSPGNSTLTVPGFFNGEQEYVIRFSPSTAGSWNYVTTSSIPQLAGLRGSITAVKNSNPDIHGAITVDPKAPQKFLYQDGTSYFALAFELDWLFALDYGNKDAIPRTKQLIQDVKNNGFNQVVMNIYANDVRWPVASDVPAEYSFGKPDYSPFRGNNDRPDFSGLNTDFFKHFDRVIEHLHARGIAAHVMIYVWNKDVKWPNVKTAEDDRYFDYVIKRYQAFPNMIWDISKEALDYDRCDIPYINERIGRARKLDAYKRLVTVHDYEYCSREPDKVDFISIQNWRADLYSYSLEAYLKHSGKPVMNIEHGGYEEGPYLSFQGNYVNPEICLMRNYECIFAGLYSTYYWQNTSWNIVIYDPFNPRHAFKKPRFDYYKYCQDLFSRYDFNTLLPSRQKLTTNSRIGPDNYSSGGYCLTNGKDLYLYLVPGVNFQINTVIPKPAGGKMDATWFNPFTGEFRDAGSSDWAIWKGYQSPWRDLFSVLIIRTR
jgi:hypothetical protein